MASYRKELFDRERQWLYSFIYYTRKISTRKQEEMQKIDRMKHRVVQVKFIPHFTGNNYIILAVEGDGIGEV